MLCALFGTINILFCVDVVVQVFRRMNDQQLRAALQHYFGQLEVDQVERTGLDNTP